MGRRLTPEERAERERLAAERAKRRDERNARKLEDMERRQRQLAALLPEFYIRARVWDLTDAKTGRVRWDSITAELNRLYPTPGECGLSVVSPGKWEWYDVTTLYRVGCEMFRALKEGQA